jgi:hypothetical protein
MPSDLVAPLQATDFSWIPLLVWLLSPLWLILGSLALALIHEAFWWRLRPAAVVIGLSVLAAALFWFRLQMP